SFPAARPGAPSGRATGAPAPVAADRRCPAWYAAIRRTRAPLADPTGWQRRHGLDGPRTRPSGLPALTPTQPPRGGPGSLDRAWPLRRSAPDRLLAPREAYAGASAPAFAWSGLHHPAGPHAPKPLAPTRPETSRKPRHTHIPSSLDRDRFAGQGAQACAALVRWPGRFVCCWPATR